ncbi:MAG TPA: protein-methionine-sulfoxide reductase heme-binding subunit MsrQ [Bryobacteraceae bacterium]|nr:protein-methionine-sulfoxide reductase heme-binding subunit MsrQ [Bryobacteraceae bacterium]
MAKSRSKIRLGKVLLWAACLSPLFRLGWRAYQSELTANPIEFITHFTGDWTIRLIVATLAVSPLRRLLNRPNLIRYRRPVGLFAFFYGCLHFLTYVWLDKFFVLSDMIKDVAKRPFITAGFTAFVCMIPLAVTSTSGWIRRLGGKRWANLHRLIYLTAVAGVIHYYWLVKSDHRLPLMYGGLVAVEFAYRLVASVRRKVAAPAPRKVLTEA